MEQKHGHLKQQSEINLMLLKRGYIVAASNIKVTMMIAKLHIKKKIIFLIRRSFVLPTLFSVLQYIS